MYKLFKLALCFTIILMLLSNLFIIGFSSYSSDDIATGSIVTFGIYPQSQVTDEKLITELNSELGENEFVSFGYFSGNGEAGSESPSDYMKYFDLSYNDEKYRAVKFSDNRPLYSYNAPGSFALGANGKTADTIYWYKYEPIEWIVLDPDSGLITTKYILDAQPYINSLNYDNSDLNHYLNNEFYNTAFLNNDENIITITEKSNKVFLLNSNDLSNQNYGFTSDESRRASGSDYLYINGYARIKNQGEYYVAYWTENYNSELNQCNVFYTSSESNNQSIYKNYGVRPAIYLDLKKEFNIQVKTQYTLNIYTEELDGKYSVQSEKIDALSNTVVSYTPESKTGFNINEKISTLSNTVKADGLTELNIYYERKSGNVIFNLGKEYEPISETYKYGQSINYPDIPDKDGYSGKWNKIDNTYDGETNEYNVIWEENTYSITFDTLGGTKINNITAHYNDKITKPSDPQKVGYTFVKWDNDIPDTMPNKNLKFTAIYSQNSYSVKWNINGKVITAKILYGDKIVIPDIPAKDGYYIVGWDKTIPETIQDSNLEFTAIYKPYPKVEIKGSKTRTELWKTTITFHAEYTGCDKSEIFWFDERGKQIGQGDSITVKEATNSYSVTVKIIQNNNIVSESKTEHIIIKKGLFDKITYFFMKLFNPTKLKIDQK